ncbi:MAG TPA: DUF4105 domain-containing protein [Vicinamibacteria bacterium]|nr:DUF4105 domain-containing protein [Vicinamibacteria bacterium]
MTVDRARSILFALTLLAPEGASGESPRIDLYTMGPGDVLFSKFGHAALCVVASDLPAGGVCYNYGTSDFSRPIGLGWEVVRGRAEFWVSVSDLVSTVLSFESDDRTIYRQALPLAPEAVTALAAALAEDASFENRVYIYNHFLENCSTRPRDHIDAATGGALRRSRVDHEPTYRDYAVEGLGSFNAVLVPVTDLIMGRWADRRITAFEAMFIPEVLRRAVEIDLGAPAEVLYERRGPIERADPAGSRRILWWLVVAFLAVNAAAGFLGQAGLARAMGALTLGGLGLFLLAAGAVSVLPELRFNELLLVFLPTDFYLLSTGTNVRNYLYGRLVLLAAVALLVVAGVLIQPLWPFWSLAFGVIALTVRGRPR